MDSEFGELLILWTVRLAVACYVLRLLIDVAGWNSSKANKIRLWIWTIGCGFFLVHVFCAFQFYHFWSHAHAYKHTAVQTAKIVGLHWGGGLYFNYLFLALWIADVYAWWRQGGSYLEQRRIYWIVQIIFAFMFFNATIVFGPVFWRWVGLAVIISLLIVWFGFKQSHDTHKNSID